MDIEIKIILIISKVSSSGISDIRLQSYFIRDLDFTALEFVELLNKVEHEFNIEFSAFEEPHIFTVEDIVKLVRVKIQ
jgi:acyl carrier protein